jgi:hypothetical protein
LVHCSRAGVHQLPWSSADDSLSPSSSAGFRITATAATAAATAANAIIALGENNGDGRSLSIA